MKVGDKVICTSNRYHRVHKDSTYTVTGVYSNTIVLDGTHYIPNFNWVEDHFKVVSSPSRKYNIGDVVRCDKDTMLGTLVKNHHYVITSISEDGASIGTDYSYFVGDKEYIMSGIYPTVNSEYFVPYTKPIEGNMNDYTVFTYKRGETFSVDCIVNGVDFITYYNLRIPEKTSSKIVQRFIEDAERAVMLQLSEASHANEV